MRINPKVLALLVANRIAPTPFNIGIVRLHIEESAHFIHDRFYYIGRRKFCVLNTQEMCDEIMGALFSRAHLLPDEVLAILFNKQLKSSTPILFKIIRNLKGAHDNRAIFNELIAKCGTKQLNLAMMHILKHKIYKFLFNCPVKKINLDGRNYYVFEVRRKRIGKIKRKI